jgi:hypothetical protein
MRLRPSITVAALYLLCSQFVSHHFACPDIPLPSALPSTTQTLRLDHFIAYALHRTRPISDGFKDNELARPFFLFAYLFVCFLLRLSRHMFLNSNSD